MVGPPMACAQECERRGANTVQATRWCPTARRSSGGRRTCCSTGCTTPPAACQRRPPPPPAPGTAPDPSSTPGLTACSERPPHDAPVEASRHRCAACTPRAGACMRLQSRGGQYRALIPLVLKPARWVMAPSMRARDLPQTHMTCSKMASNSAHPSRSFCNASNG